MKKFVRILAGSLLPLGMLLFMPALTSCGGDDDEPDGGANQENTDNKEEPGDNADIMIPEGFQTITLTKGGDIEEVLLPEVGYLTVRNNGMGVYDLSHERGNTLIKVGKMESIFDMPKGRYMGFTIDHDINHRQAIAGYGYQTCTSYGTKYARFYVTDVKYNPYSVTLYYESPMPGIPTDARIYIHGSWIPFQKERFENTDIVVSEVEVQSKYAFSVASKPSFVKDVICEKNKIIVTVDRTQIDYPDAVQRGYIILENDWVQSCIGVVYGRESF